MVLFSKNVVQNEIVIGLRSVTGNTAVTDFPISLFLSLLVWPRKTTRILDAEKWNSLQKKKKEMAR